MALVLLFFPLLSASLVSLAFGVDFATCKGSSCPAWHAFLDDSAKEVTVYKHSREEGSTFQHKQRQAEYYRIKVKSSGTSFTTLHRYSDFATLKDKLGDVATELSPFPPKLYLNTFVESFWPGTLEDRRKQLEVWLQKILAYSDSKGPWADDLFHFLDPVTSVTIAKSGVSMPMDANKLCKDHSVSVVPRNYDKYAKRKYYFGIDVDTHPARVWRRYKEFRRFRSALKKLGGMDENFGVHFPPKLAPWIKGERVLEERRRGLQAWLAQVKAHPNSDLGQIWENQVKTFLDPAGNQNTTGLDCMLGDAIYEQLEKMNTQITEL